MHEPIQEPATAPWGLSISDDDFAKLKAGFEPQDQDDKWRFSVTDQSQSGNISIHVIRNGSHAEHYALDVKPGDGSSSSIGGAKIEAITWEQNMGGIRMPEDLAKIVLVLIARSVLECDFEALPEYDTNEVHNHPAYQLEKKTSTN